MTMTRKLVSPIFNGLVPALLSVAASARAADPPSPTNARYVAPSATVELMPDAKLEHLFTLNSTQPYLLQKLTQRSYFFGAGNYTTTFYVGDHGVLLFDPLQGQGAKISRAIASVTKLPVTAIVYSHTHTDHIGDTKLILDAASAAGAKRVRVIASAQTAAKLKFLGSHLPAPTETVAWPSGSFSFEGLEVRLHGFVRAAHTDDAAGWLLASERVLHLPDLVNPDQPPFWRFAGSENYTYYRANLKEVAALNWTFLNGGHGNVGSKKDLEFYDKFLTDLEACVAKAMASTPFGSGVDARTVNAHTAFLPAWLGIIAKKATDELRPRYGQLYGFEYGTPSNAEMVAESGLDLR
jgi:glyoxylase-like metal-dependent hydrolase (beta-lactamase superfamily II)